MKDTPEQTKRKILESARQEFLQKGFAKASLRSIAANANLTTGAMYGHFKDKDALFCALVDDAVNTTRRTIELAGPEKHSSLAFPAGRQHAEEEAEMIRSFISYLYQNMDSFILLLEKSQGSSHANFLQETADLYSEKCAELVDWFERKGLVKIRVDAMTVHVIASNFITSIAELVFHRIPPEQAEPFIESISRFYHFGWVYLFGMKIDE